MEGTGLSTLLPDEAARRQAEGYPVGRIGVAVRPLDDLLAEAGLDGQPIHFCKVDVEGAEPEVLAGFDLPRWRPWVLVVEAVRPQSNEPSSSAWEEGVLAAGYQLCLFDGLNRFYVAPEHPELAGALSVPASVLDMPYATYRQLQQEDSLRRQLDELGERLQATSSQAAGLEARATRSEALAAASAGDAILWRRRYLDSLAAEVELEDEAELLRGELDATHQTLSWRVTAPLRHARAGAAGVKRFIVRVETAAGRSRTTVRAVQWGQRHVPVVRRVRHRIRPELRDRANRWWPSCPPHRHRLELLRPASRPLDVRVPTPAADQALAARLLTASSLLDGAPAGDGELAEALDRFERALGKPALPPAAVTWLALVAFTASYPKETRARPPDPEVAARRAAGPRPRAAPRRWGARLAGRPRLEVLRIVDGGVVVDVTHTASHDLHTGIQRVVRETVSRWLDDHEFAAVRLGLRGGRAVRPA